MNKKVWSPCCFVKSTEIKKAIANCTSLVLSDKRKKLSSAKDVREGAMTSIV